MAIFSLSVIEYDAEWVFFFTESSPYELFKGDDRKFQCRAADLQEANYIFSYLWFILFSIK